MSIYFENKSITWEDASILWHQDEEVIYSEFYQDTDVTWADDDISWIQSEVSAPNAFYKDGDTDWVDGDTYWIQAEEILTYFKDATDTWENDDDEWHETVPTARIVQIPVILPITGAYLDTQLIDITCGTLGATIHYTEDGSTPDITDPIYTSALVLGSAKTIKAIAIKTEYTDSSVASAAYTISEWLDDWAYRIKVWSDNTNIDSDLTHFPSIIVLGESVGQLDQDVTPIFDELSLDANRFKIAITKIDGLTQIYGDIEFWDNANEKAVIHVAKSDLDILSASKTELYIYFDSAQADNTTYISDSGGTAAQSVYKTATKGAWNKGETSGDALDSTSNSHDGTVTGAVQNVDAPVGKAYTYNEGTDRVDLSSHVANLEGFNAGTIVAMGKLDSSAAANNDIFYLSEGDSSSVYNFMAFRVGNGNISGDYADESVMFTLWRGNTEILTMLIRDGEGYYADDSYHQFAVRTGNGDNALFIDGVKKTTTFDEGSVTTNEFSNIDTPDFAAIGNRKFGGTIGGTGWKGDIAEVVFTSESYSDAWIKAMFYASTDDLLTYSEPEEAPPLSQVIIPVIDPASGEYPSSQQITITCGTVGATIYYTEDGSDPDSGDTEYTVPFTLSAAKTIKAIGIKGGLTDSEIVSETYTISEVSGVRPVIFISIN